MKRVVVALNASYCRFLSTSSFRSSPPALIHVLLFSPPTHSRQSFVFGGEILMGLSGVSFLFAWARAFSTSDGGARPASLGW